MSVVQIMAKLLDAVLTTLYKTMISTVQAEGRLAALVSLRGEALLVQQAISMCTFTGKYFVFSKHFMQPVTFLRDNISAIKAANIRGNTDSGFDF